MDIKNLKLFADVATLGSFAAAARKYDMDASSVSRMISNLEFDLGVRLIQRTTRSQSLTEAGARYLSTIQPLIDELDRAAELARGISSEPTGCLRLASSVAFGQECIVPLISRFQSEFPGIDLELVLSDANVDLISENIDLSIRLGRHIDQDMISTKLMSTQYRVVVSPEYLKLNPNFDTPEMLKTHNCVVFTNPDLSATWQFQAEDGALTEVPVSGSLRVSNALALRAAAIQGLGPSLLADWMTAKERASGLLIDVFPDYRVTATTFETAAWLIYPSKTYLARKVRVMIDFLKTHLSNDLERGKVGQ